MADVTAAIPCRNRPQDCRCVEHARGLLDYCRSPEQEAELRTILEGMRQPLTLSTLTFGPEPGPIQHDPATYTCRCEQCCIERASIRPQGYGNAVPIKRAA